MSLSFALAAAINGPTGPRATLSHGLSRTKPHRRRSGPKDSHSSEVAAQPPATLSHKLRRAVHFWNKVTTVIVTIDPTPLR